ncbi:MAG: winged helix-turn-helix domain-containing protein [Candidatus Bathyarchaeota archaeon]|nr:winged helix-turn-helix domain-containing protein [Candidatus Bathyarchaeota archaeon]
MVICKAAKQPLKYADSNSVIENSSNKGRFNMEITDVESKRRDKLNIIAEILEIAKEGTLKTQIMYKANLSFTQLNEYLRFMLKNELLKKLSDKGKTVYAATPKGLDFLQRYCELTELLKEAEKGKNGVKIPPQKLLKNA